MKRIIPAILLVALTTFLCIFGNIYVNQKCDSAKEELRTLRETVKTDSEKAKKDATKFEKEWYSTQKRLALFVNHSLLDGASSEITALPHCTDEISDFNISAAKAERLLNQIVCEERIGIESFY